MAKRSKSEDTEAHHKSNAPAAPEGFDIKIGRERGDGWLAKKEGVVVMGRLLGRHEFKGKGGKMRGFYQILLSQGTTAMVTDPDDEEAVSVEMELKEGQILNVDEIKKLEDLRPYVKDGGTYDVWFALGAKIDIGENSMWKVYGPQLKIVSRPAELP